MRCLLLILFLFTASLANAQSLVCKGTVMTAEGKTLPDVNILAKPQSDKASVAFAITDDKGHYTIKLVSGQTYELTVSYLGFLPQTINFSPSDTAFVQNFKLIPAENQLDEVVVNATIPVIVKEDTLIYNTSAFASGEERKLRDLLNKLPGVEVSTEGRITVRGKQVNKVMIEGKSFFNGTSMAVNNIPADVVNQIEVLSNYNDVSYLKGFENDNTTAMNIKLKANKKGFVFGDIELSGGAQERYAVQPNIFYYSPNTQLNVIADFNNTGVKSFGMADYLSFEGNYKTQTDFTYPDNDLTRFISAKNYAANTQQFGAINFRQSLTDKTAINTYFILSKNKMLTRTETRNEFLNFKEQRDIQDELNSTFLTGKVSLESKPTENSGLFLNSFITLRSNDAAGSITSGQQINVEDQLQGISLKQQFNYSHKLSARHTGIIEGSLQYKKDNLDGFIHSNEQLLPGYIPLLTDAEYEVQRERQMGMFGGDFQIKDYWVLHPSHHIYLSAGANISKNTYYTQEAQLLSQGEINHFSDSGFGNDLNYQQTDFYAGLEYKVRAGIVTLKPALFYHRYSWLSTSKSVVLPSLLTKLDVGKKRDLELRYDLKSAIPDVSMLASGMVMQDFNLVLQGRSDLANELYHLASLNFSQFDFSATFFLNAGIQYRRKTEQAKPMTILNRADQLSTFRMFYLPESDFSMNINANKKIGTIKYLFETRYESRDFFQLTNGETEKNTAKSIMGGTGLRTLFKSAPNLSANYTLSLNKYQAGNNTSRFIEHVMQAGLSYRFAKHFYSENDYTRSWYNGLSFDKLNANLRYQQEGSPWGFSIVATNLTNTRYRRNNSFSSLYISDSRIFILPRMVLARLLYKL